MNWLPYIPTDLDTQVSRNTDFEACASYSAIHILEMVLKKQTGLFWELSERYLAKTADTQPWGNSIQNVVDALNANGVCLVDYWPELTYSTNYEYIDWATYYRDIPLSVKNSAYRVQASLRKITSPQMAALALNDAPLWTIVKVSSGQLHIVAQLNDSQFFDSYQITVKNFSDGYPIQSQYQLIIKPINMPNTEFVHKAGTGEYGFYLPTLSPDALKDKAMNLGINILNPDGSINFTLAKEVTGL